MAKPAHFIDINIYEGTFKKKHEIVNVGAEQLMIKETYFRFKSQFYRN
jgi:hypothetical protein